MSDDNAPKQKYAQFSMHQVRPTDRSRVPNQQVPIDRVELPVDLVKEIIDQSTMTIAVPHGDCFTIIPLDDTAPMVIAEAYRVLQIIKKEPTLYVNTLLQRQDELVRAVDNMFGHNEFKQIGDKDALAELVAWHYGKKVPHIPLIVKRPRLGTMYELVVGRDGEPKTGEEQL